MGLPALLAGLFGSGLDFFALQDRLKKYDIATEGLGNEYAADSQLAIDDIYNLIGAGGFGGGIGGYNPGQAAFDAANPILEGMDPYSAGFDFDAYEKGAAGNFNRSLGFLEGARSDINSLINQAGEAAGGLFDEGRAALEGGKFDQQGAIDRVFEGSGLNDLGASVQGRARRAEAGQAASKAIAASRRGTGADPANAAAQSIAENQISGQFNTAGLQAEAADQAFLGDIAKAKGSFSTNLEGKGADISAMLAAKAGDMFAQEASLDTQRALSQGGLLAQLGIQESNLSAQETQFLIDALGIDSSQDLAAMGIDIQRAGALGELAAGVENDEKLQRDEQMAAIMRVLGIEHGSDEFEAALAAARLGTPMFGFGNAMSTAQENFAA